MSWDSILIVFAILWAGGRIARALDRYNANVRTLNAHLGLLAGTARVRETLERVNQDLQS